MLPVVTLTTGLFMAFNWMAVPAANAWAINLRLPPLVFVCVSLAFQNEHGMREKFLQSLAWEKRLTEPQEKLRRAVNEVVRSALISPDDLSCITGSPMGHISQMVTPRNTISHITGMARTAPPMDTTDSPSPFGTGTPYGTPFGTPCNTPMDVSAGDAGCGTSPAGAASTSAARGLTFRPVPQLDATRLLTNSGPDCFVNFTAAALSTNGGGCPSSFTHGTSATGSSLISPLAAGNAAPDLKTFASESGYARLESPFSRHFFAGRFTASAVEYSYQTLFLKKHAAAFIKAQQALMLVSWTNLLIDVCVTTNCGDRRGEAARGLLRTFIWVPVILVRLAETAATIILFVRPQPPCMLTRLTVA